MPVVNAQPRPRVLLEDLPDAAAAAAAPLFATTRRVTYGERINPAHGQLHAQQRTGGST